jgi:ubiquitin carboxyl-terminal hydrolase 25
LFTELESSTDSAVTPSLELAKLALVTSKDEEDDTELGKAGTDSSNSTDTTLVEEPGTTGTEQSTLDTKSILGKAERVEQGEDVPMVKSADSANTSKTEELPTPPPLPPRKKQVHSDSVMMFGTTTDMSFRVLNSIF